MRNISDKVVDKSKHTLYIQKLFSANRAVYEIMWENMVMPGRRRRTI
jgi:hypothetical protein